MRRAWSAGSIRRCPAIISPISASWLTEGRALEIPFPSGPFSMSPAASLAIVAAWIAVLIALTFRSFRRQDIN